MQISKQRPSNRTVIVALIVVLAVAGVGYGIYSKRIKTNSTSAVEQVQTPKITDPKPTSATQAPTGSEQPYALEIKEWGISVPLPESVKDAYYVVSTNSADADGSPNNVWIGLNSAANCPAENANKGGRALGSINRVRPNDTDPVSGELSTKMRPDGIIIGDYYYGFHISVGENDCTSQETFKKVDDAFKTAIKRATAVTPKSTISN